ncbi:MAG: alpha/beta hydrolase [Solirubrobacterales bacterium]|nr:alpha/beta hydrolase [Solirubrobacterales bacterium]
MDNTRPTTTETTQFLDLPVGRLAYDDAGEGQLIVATPAMLDLRSELRFLRPLLLEAGFRVVTVDQRGMGETSGRWPEYGSIPLAHDLIALLRHLEAGPAVIYGTSNGAAAAVYVAAEAPDLVRGLVLSAPFVRDGQMSWIQRQLMNIMRLPFLTLPIYLSYFPKWEPKRPADFDEHMARLKANLQEPNRRGVVRAYMLEQSHAEAEARLGQVTVPSLIIMGTGDVDWPDPAAEARWIQDKLGSELLMLDRAGHHPHVEYPREIADAVVAFNARLWESTSAAAASEVSPWAPGHANRAGQEVAPGGAGGLEGWAG